jgi:hypothetical protein
MTRHTRQTLIRALSVTTVVGVCAYAYTHTHRKPDDSAARGPTTGPTTEPVRLALLSADEKPTTKPAGNGAPNKPLVNHPDAKPDAKSDLKPDAKPPVKPDPKPDAKSDAKSEAPARLAATVVNANPAAILPEGKAKIEAGELLAGRKILNDGLISGQLTGTEVVAAKQLLSEANKAILFSTRRFNDDPWAGTHQVASGEVLAKIALKEAVTTDLLLQMNGMTDPRKLRAGSTIKIIHGPIHAVVSKKSFNLDLYLGSPGEKGAQFIANYPVGLGKDDSTPAGTWIISDRLLNPKWWGARGIAPIEAGDPKNPLGKYWLALTGIDGKAEGQQSYGIHGTIEPDSIGKQASMGCIRMRNEDAAVVYALVVSGKSTVVVRD